MIRFLLPLLLISSFSFGQGYVKRDVKIQETNAYLQLDKIALGFGSFFDEPRVTFSKEAMYVSIQAHILGLPFLKEGTSTGLSFEGHPGALFTKSLEGGRFQTLENVDWRLWSITRIPLSITRIKKLSEGTPARMFTGADLLIAEGGPEDFTRNFNARLVLGGDMGRIGPGTIVFEVYSFQKDMPISFAIFYGF